MTRTDNCSHRTETDGSSSSSNSSSRGALVASDCEPRVGTGSATGANESLDPVYCGVRVLSEILDPLGLHTRVVLGCLDEADEGDDGLLKSLVQARVDELVY
jgi:hypothetical protein